MLGHFDFDNKLIKSEEKSSKIDNSYGPSPISPLEKFRRQSPYYKKRDNPKRERWLPLDHLNHLPAMKGDKVKIIDGDGCGLNATVIARHIISKISTKVFEYRYDLKDIRGTIYLDRERDKFKLTL